GVAIIRCMRGGIETVGTLVKLGLFVPIPLVALRIVHLAGSSPQKIIRITHRPCPPHKAVGLRPRVLPPFGGGSGASARGCPCRLAPASLRGIAALWNR